MFAAFKKRNLVTSTGLLRTPLIEEFLGGEVYFSSSPILPMLVSNVVGWGAAESGRRARDVARKLRRPFILLEDGFLRSVSPGYSNQPWSMVKDFKGIYFDCGQHSSLEMLLDADESPIVGLEENTRRARQLITRNSLSKYNHAPSFDNSCFRVGDIERVLVIDQTVGDKSVSLGGASEKTFRDMLCSASTENPRATIYVKTHPEVSHGKKLGFLSDLSDDKRVVVLRDLLNPLELLSYVDKVYCVTSTMGFEALLMGKSVTCFGVPWYSGWGVTDDRQPCSRRRKVRTVDELFAAAYFRYSVYVNPYTLCRGDLFDVIRWLIEQRRRFG